MRIIGPDADGHFRIILDEMASLDADLEAVIAMITGALRAAKELTRWHLLSGVRTMATAGGGMAFYVIAAKKWEPAGSGELLS